MHFFTTKPPTDPNDDYYRCMCGISVHSFVYGLSIFEIIIGFAMLIALFVMNAILLAPLGVIVICMGLLLMWGNRRMVWWAYVLELCQWICSAFSNFMVTGLVMFYGVAALFVNLDYSYMHKGYHPSGNPDKFEHRALMALAIIIAGIFHLMFSLVFAYFTCVLVRAFQYVYKFGRTHQKLTGEEEFKKMGF